MLILNISLYSDRLCLFCWISNWMTSSLQDLKYALLLFCKEFTVRMSSKHLEIKKHLIGKMFQKNINLIILISSSRIKTTLRHHWETWFNYRSQQKRNATIFDACNVLVFLCDCHQLGPAQGSWAAVHWEIWHHLRIKDKSCWRRA